MPEVTARKIRNLCIFKNSSCSKFFLPQSQLIKQVSPQAAQSDIFVKLHIIQMMHLLEGPDLGHSMIYYDGKLEKKR